MTTAEYDAAVEVIRGRLERREIGYREAEAALAALGPRP